MSRPSLIRAILVVSSDGAVRSDWAEFFEAHGVRTRRCVGPQVLCALLRGEHHCPLHDEADMALYDYDSFTPALRRHLLTTARLIPIAIARDCPTAAGRHEPLLVEVIPPTPLQRSTG